MGRAGWRSRANGILETTVKKVVREKRMPRLIAIAISGNEVHITRATIDINNELNYVFLPGIEQCILMRLQYIRYHAICRATIKIFAILFGVGSLNVSI